MSDTAWVTLATNDTYSLGALVLANSLRDVGTRHHLAVLITPGVTGPMRDNLSKVFNTVQEVNVLDSKDEANLRLLKRPELGITFTKLHCWKLTQFKKCVFLDADTLVLQNCDELFERDEFSAAPDVGWPDCFNSGVFVYCPSNDTYEQLIRFALEKGSFDGGDQGLLNSYFADWAHKDISKHLPFIYNMCSTAAYSYLPAFVQFGANAKIVHFIGNTKPWQQHFDLKTKRVIPSPELTHLTDVLQKWWNIFCAFIHPQLNKDMGGLAGLFAQCTLGADGQTALQDHIHRQSWEVGNIDYLGRDSFDNIWSKICQTLGEDPAKKEETSATDAVKVEEEAKPQPKEAPVELPKPTDTTVPQEVKTEVKDVPKTETPPAQPIPPAAETLPETLPESQKLPETITPAATTTTVITPATPETPINEGPEFEKPATVAQPLTSDVQDKEVKTESTPKVSQVVEEKVQQPPAAQEQPKPDAQTVTEGPKAAESVDTGKVPITESVLITAETTATVEAKEAVKQTVEKDQPKEVISEQPKVPEQPKAPVEPKVPEQPKAPEEPKVPEQPKVPEEPKVPEQPKAPEEPKVPEQPKIPEQTKPAEQPKAPEEPKIAEQPKVPEQPQVPEEPKQKAPETPKPIATAEAKVDSKLRSASEEKKVEEPPKKAECKKPETKIEGDVKKAEGEEKEVKKVEAEASKPEDSKKTEGKKGESSKSEAKKDVQTPTPPPRKGASEGKKKSKK